MAEVGAGGPGPAIELTSLRRIAGSGMGAVPSLWTPAGPFVETEEWAGQQMATLRAAGYEPTTRHGDDDYLHDYLDVFGDVGERVWHEERDRGAILISHSGCGMTSWLSVDCRRAPPTYP
ncbi:hypothetical protein [Streptomyces sp. NPDC001312]|uniref:hypothetical protein n=1 Tax=Streptomyces sp. NPDC001312 TaxID=3364561 RepID=UPI0036AC941B